MFAFKTWRGRSFDLGRMTLAELVRAFATFYAIQTYVALALVAIVLTFVWAGPGAWQGVLGAVAVALLVYPLVEYGLHRYVLHGRYLYKSPLTSQVWKRIHFDHHQDPHRLEVLFGALSTTLPTIAIATAPIGWVLGGPPGAAAGFATGLLTTVFYEFCHCVQHLNYKPRWGLLARMKQLHLAHHFHSEKGNFGITSFVLDRLFGTYYAGAKDTPRSVTVFNLGYDETEAQRYPWVARLSKRQPMSRPPRYAEEARLAEGPARSER